MSDSFSWPGFLPAFAEAAGACGFMSVELLRTPHGPLMAWERAGSGPPVYLSAGIHGDEPAGPLALLALMEEGFFPDGRHFIVCPALNPSGLALGTRENAEGKDLNRDYLKRSSVETEVHARWLDEKPLPGLFISLHEDWETSGFYLYEINLGADRPHRVAALLAAVEEIFPPESGPEIDGHEVRAAGWIFHACEADLPDEWPEAIHLAKRGCPLSYTLETPSCARLGDRVAAHLAAVRSLLSDPQMGIE